MGESHYYCKPLPYLILAVLMVVALWLLYIAFTGPNLLFYLVITLVWIIVAAYIAASVKIADQWEKAVVLRLGNYTGLKGPGLFRINPILEKVVYWIDARIITTTFKAEKTLTKGTVPVDVEAILFWKVLDPEKAALQVEDYRSAISLAS